MNPVLEVKNLSVSWGQGARVVEEVSFSVEPGELVGIIGPSGCGKSSLCLALAGIIPRQLPGRVEGEIMVLGRSLAELSLPEIACDLGLVFQDPETQLFLPRVMNELAFGPENLCVPGSKIVQTIRSIAGETGCEDLLECNPNELSGGQQQLIALAAVLTMEPKLLLLDEVTSQLDPESCQRIQAVISVFLQRGGAVLMVEHNLEQLVQANRILCFKAGRLEAAAAENLFQDENLLTSIYGDRP